MRSKFAYLLFSNRPWRSIAAWTAFAVVPVAVFVAVLQWASSAPAPTAAAPPRAPASIVSSPVTGPDTASSRPAPAAAPQEAPNVTLTVVRESHFAWPATGDLTTYFGPGHPTGIDIGLDLRVDTPIRASASGVVSFAGGNACCDFGLHVLIDHGAGVSTLYGHLAKVTVEEGQWVAQGDVIGLGGSTGNASGKHLHFEIDGGAGPVDPLRYLPFVQESPYVGRVEAARCPSDRLEIDPDSSVIFDFDAGGLAGYRLKDTSVTVSNNFPFRLVLSEATGPLGVILKVPPAVSASGATVLFDVTFRLVSDSDTRNLSCTMGLTTRQTLPNPTPTPRPDGPEATAAALALTPTETPTPTPIRPKATVTPSPRPSQTPVKPTATVGKAGSPTPTKR